jgi:hypothetical protein
MRRFIPVLALFLLAAFPAMAAAAPPPNDAIAGATTLDPGYTTTGTTITIPPDGPTGWQDSTVTDEDNSPKVPSCLASAGYHSMWWLVTVGEASVLSVTLTSSSVRLYQPVVTIIGPVNSTTGATPQELACGLGQDDSRNDPSAMASSYVGKGQYLVRAASVQTSVSGQDSTDLPTITLLAKLQDVTPPQISVLTPTKLVGVGKTYTFDARDTADSGSTVNFGNVQWAFSDLGRTFGSSKPGPPSLIGQYAWKSPGLHKVVLTVQDKAGNTNTYTFFQFVHNFVAPKVSLLVHVPAPGAGQIRLSVTHDVPVKLRIVVLQGGKKLRVLESKLIKGSNTTTTLRVALKSRVKAGGFVVVSGVASDLSSPPNTVPLLTCSVDPVHGGGVCG